jgi:hypothetical protein
MGVVPPRNSRERGAGRRRVSVWARGGSGDVEGRVGMVERGRGGCGERIAARYDLECL